MIILVSWFHLVQSTIMDTLSLPAERQLVLPPCFHGNLERPGKQEGSTRNIRNIMILFEKTGAGEEIRTLDPNLGKVVLYP